MKDSNYLATTAISEIWDLDSDLLLLGPWCLTGEKNKKLLENRRFTLIPSLWKPASKIKKAADYCHQIYEELLPQLSESMNSIHHVSYPVKYWRVLLGPWLLHFVGILYDRYKRIENVLKLFPDFYTYVLSKEQCKSVSFDTYDFLGNQVNEDYYNLKLFSLVAYDLCPQNTIVKDYKSEYNIYTSKYSWKRKLFNKLVKLLDLFFRDPIVLTDMYHLSCADMFFIKLKTGFKTVRFIDFEPREKKSLGNKYSYEFRKEVKLKGAFDRFQSLLYKTIPEAIPMCYMENYKFYRTSIKVVSSVKMIGSAVGWSFDKRFKFFAAEAVSNGGKLIDFQHGGGYGMSLVISSEAISMEKDIFYTWGWSSKEDAKIKPLPSPHLSRLKDTHSPKLDNILFVGMAIPRYRYRFHTVLQSDDMPKYFEDKKIFFQVLPDEVRDKILYRPYFYDYGWGEVEIVKKVCPNVKVIVKGRLVDWMKKVKLVVVDHPHTSFIEALTINVPCIFYWDHEIYLMRNEAEKYFQLLRDAEILFKNPLSAAKKVKEIFNDPIKWWLSNDVQKARLEFCNQYAYARKDWLKMWIQELSQLKNRL